MVVAFTAAKQNQRDGFTKNVTLTSAQVLTLNSVPTTVLTAPVNTANALLVTSVYATIAAGTAYASVHNILLNYTSGSGALIATITAAGFMDQTAALGARGSINSALITPGALVCANCATGDPTTGTSPIKLRIRYRIEKVPAF